MVAQQYDAAWRQAFAEGLRTLAGQLFELAEETQGIGCSIELGEATPLVLQRLRDLRTICSHPPFTYSELAEGEADA